MPMNNKKIQNAIHKQPGVEWIIFLQMPWKSTTQMCFARVNQTCNIPVHSTPFFGHESSIFLPLF